ncbi:MAG: helix-turn-helix transcriptional regulator [Lachnospiraceae bacterium]|nr:helix-turn-helix transcriptional regulator [Lachnospiraceae bacterium]
MKKKYYIDKERYIALANRMKKDGKNITEKLIADNISVSLRTIQGYFGKNPKPVRSDNFEKIAAFLGVSAQWLSGEYDSDYDETGKYINTDVYQKSARDLLYEYLEKKGLLTPEFGNPAMGYYRKINGKMIIHSVNATLIEQNMPLAIGPITEMCYIDVIEKAIEQATTLFTSSVAVADGINGDHLH